jgi:type I restriction enzyme S subunit
VTNWQEMPLGDACRLLTDGDWIETKDQSGHDYRLLQVSNIGVGRFVETGKFRYITRDTFHRLRCTEVVPGMILVSRMPTPIGRAWFVNRLGERAITAVDIAILDPDPDVLDGRFCAYALNAPDRLAHWQSAASGTTRARITRRQLSEHIIQIPPINSQRAIVGVLGAIDDLIENNQRRVVLLEEMAQALYREWFVRFRYPGHEDDELVDSVLGRIPTGWTTATVGDVAEVNRAQRRPSNGDSLVYIDISALGDRSLDLPARINGAAAPGRARRVLEDGDVLWSMVRPGRRAHALLGEAGGDWLASTGVAVLSARTVPPGYLFEATSTKKFSDYLVGKEGGAAYPAVKPADFVTAPIVLPAAETLARFNELVAPVHRLSWLLRAERRAAARIRDILLPKLVSGAIDVSHLDLNALLAEPAA